MNPEDRLAAIAASIADGSAIDWLAAASDATDPDHRAVLKELKAIAAITTLHRTPSTSAIEAVPPASARWGPLTVTATIGHGRFGEVHLAWDARLQRRVALKRLHLASRSVAASPTRAIEEARLLARVRHPNVLSVYGAECIDDEIGIWTEFIEGRTLEAMLSDGGPMRPADVISIGIDLAGALGAVHAAGLLHRDVKAQNVMRETGGRIVLMDFGTGHDLALVSPKAGDLSGTPLYLAPEIFTGGSATASSDLYALGVLLFRLLTAQYPVEGQTLQDVRIGHARNGARTLRDLRPDLPSALIAAVDRALAPDPSARHENARGFEVALSSAGKALEQQDEPTVARDAVAVAPGRYLSRPLLWRSLAAGTVAAGAIIAFALDIGDLRRGWFGRGSQGKVLPAADVASMSVRKLASFPAHRLMGRPSQTGGYVPYVDPEGDLSMWEIGTGTSQRVIRHGAADAQAEWSVMSPDDRRVAYSWYTPAGTYELRVVDVDGTSPRLILTDDVSDYPIPLEWSRDGQYLLCVLPQRDGSTHLALVPMSGAGPRILQTFRASPPRNASLSPDGRFVVYDLPNAAKDGRRDVWIAGTDGSVVRLLVGERANNLMPFWTPDGAQVFFTSDRSGSMDGWVVPVTNGVASGEPTFVARNMGRVSALSLTRDGRYFYRLQTNGQDVYTVPIDFNGTTPPSAPRRISPAIVGGHIGPGWSPDGRFIAYVSALGNTALDRDSNVLTIQDAQSGSTRDLAVSLSSLGVAAPQWSPDRRSLLVRGTDSEDRPGAFRVDVETGYATAAVLWSQSRTSEYSGFRWSRDGRGVVYLHDPRGIIVRDFSTGREAELVSNRANSEIRSFVVSPDGASLAFAAMTTTDGSHALHVQTTGQSARHIFNVSGPERLVVQAWMPDPDALLVTRFKAGSPEPHRLWMIRVASGAARDLGVSIRGNTQTNRLALSPDGRLVAYTEGVVSWETWVMEQFLPKAPN